MAELDVLASPYHFPLAGVHGAERRDIHDQRISFHSLTLIKALHTQLSRRLSRFRHTAGSQRHGFRFALSAGTASRGGGLALARSGGGCTSTAGAAAGQMRRGDKTEGLIKALLLRRLWRNRHLRDGRRFIGDDLTDEAGFRVVNQAGGIAVKVGPGDTVAEWRLADVASVWQWISDIANQQQQQIAQSKGGNHYGSLSRRL
jgi:trehalose 6-phosphate phosphatase